MPTLHLQVAPLLNPEQYSPLAQALTALTARVLGKPARHVSGYVLDPHTGEVSPQGWAEVWLEGRWASYDVQHGQAAGPCHVKLAVGMDYLDACPVRGQRMANTASADQGGQMLPAAQQSAQQ